MSTTERDIQTQPAPPPRRQPQITTPEQAAIRRELCQAYGLEEHQVGFTDPYNNEPILDFDALFALANVLLDPERIEIVPADVDFARGYCTADCLIEVDNGRRRKIFGSAFVGETLYDGSAIANLSDALDLARARALRGGLRAVGFNPMKAHRNAMAAKSEPGAVATGFSDLAVQPVAGAKSEPGAVATGFSAAVAPAIARNASAAGADCPTCRQPWADCRCGVQPANARDVETRRETERQAHAIGERIGLIGTNPHYGEFRNKEHWRWLLQTFFRKSSMADLTDVEQSQWLQTLRSLERQFDAGNPPRLGH